MVRGLLGHVTKICVKNPHTYATKATDKETTHNTQQHTEGEDGSDLHAASDIGEEFLSVQCMWSLFPRSAGHLGPSRTFFSCTTEEGSIGVQMSYKTRKQCTTCIIHTRIHPLCRINMVLNLYSIMLGLLALFGNTFNAAESHSRPHLPVPLRTLRAC